MATVLASASTSLDGFIAGPDESGFEHLFDWYGNGDIEIGSANPGVTWRLSEASAGVWRSMTADTAVLVVGRHLFDITDGWGGTHPIGVPVVVVTHEPPTDWVEAHPDAEFTFVTEGVAAAIALASGMAGDRVVGVNGGTMAAQALELGLLDVLGVDLVPVVLGSGTPLLSGLGGGPYLLDGPEVTQGDRVTHLRYTVRRP